MAVDIVIEDERWDEDGFTALANRVESVVFGHFELSNEDWEFVILACNDERIVDLNTQFRGKPSPTNVLSWPSEERGATVDGGMPARPLGPDTELGDIAIAYETCRQEAAEAGKPIDDHVTHLLIHGLLHLLGFDHIRDGDATLMEGIETSLLGKLGISDPYC